MLKWNKVKNLNTANDKEFYYIIEVFVDYRLSTVQLKKKKIKILHLHRNTYSKR